MHLFCSFVTCIVEVTYVNLGSPQSHGIQCILLRKKRFQYLMSVPTPLLVEQRPKEVRGSWHHSQYVDDSS